MKTYPEGAFQPLSISPASHAGSFFLVLQRMKIGHYGSTWIYTPGSHHSSTTSHGLLSPLEVIAVTVYFNFILW